MAKDNEHAHFYLKAENESICLRCFATVRASGYMPLNIAERDHVRSCLMWYRKPVKLGNCC